MTDGAAPSGARAPGDGSWPASGPRPGAAAPESAPPPSPLARVEAAVLDRAKALAIDVSKPGGTGDLRRLIQAEVAQLVDGSRIHIVHGDIALGGHMLVNIRRFTGVPYHSLAFMFRRSFVSSPVGTS
ncbi:MAG: hypothetical protein ACYDH5_15680 [Acidimicrobiales bacterium]